MGPGAEWSWLRLDRRAGERCRDYDLPDHAMTRSFDPERWHQILPAQSRRHQPSESDAPNAALTEAQIAEAEAFHGVVYPEAYKWVVLNYLDVELDSRVVHLGGFDDRILEFTDPFYSPRLEVYGGWEFDAGSAGLGEPAISWERRVLTHAITGGSHESYCFDFDFDEDDPPIVRYDWHSSWIDGAGRHGWGTQIIDIVADSFVDLIELPVDLGREDVEMPVGPKQRREQEWLEWRDARMRPCWDAWAEGHEDREHRLKITRERNGW